MICPNCKGLKYIFPLILPLLGPLPDDFPCRICNAEGVLPENITWNPHRGAALKRNRMDEHKLTLREYCIKYHLSAVTRSEEERGFFRRQG